MSATLHVHVGFQRSKTDEIAKSRFANKIVRFWKKMQKPAGGKNVKRFEGVSPSFGLVAGWFLNPGIVHGKRKIRLFAISSNLEMLKNDQPERKWGFSDRLLV